MSQEQDPNIEEIKERVEITVEEDDIVGLKADEKTHQMDVVAEFKKLGRQFGETLEAVWNSEERVRVETEIRAGVHSFADEVDKVIREAKSSPTIEKVKGEAAEAKSTIESSDIGEKARVGIVQGLSWMSEELANLAEQFTPPEKSPADASEDTPAEEPTAEPSPDSE